MYGILFDTMAGGLLFILSVQQYKDDSVIPAVCFLLVSIVVLHIRFVNNSAVVFDALAGPWLLLVWRREYMDGTFPRWVVSQFRNKL